MKHIQTQQSGFTLIETLIAIFILALTIGALLTLTAGGFFSIRYAKNDIVASNLLQESLEYIRNTRDTAAQESLNDSAVSWDTWKLQYDECFGSDGCVINPYPVSPSDVVDECPGGSRGNGCEPLSYLTDDGLYMYVQSGLTTPFQSSEFIETSFIRNVVFEDISTPTGPQLRVTARMDWKNGTNDKHLTQSIILTPWNIPE